MFISQKFIPKISDYLVLLYTYLLMNCRILKYQMLIYSASKTR